jgi:hypothetical protein
LSVIVRNCPYFMIVHRLLFMQFIHQFTGVSRYLRAAHLIIIIDYITRINEMAGAKESLL